ncbi:phage NrS-1 polymerase family protein [Tissierella creatinophila]|uniref:NrS-1 polymerase-like HBD domain-containing protein n=1 Tax=Tissierella creatinophila DSM 6911 TaxID=1123403 RepID=A0A1U7M4K2_TISCR|nr:hypothetical protein [Tissierella creatinophila]OLS02243.1 hypothetical protein TICRE_17740 [Tissierella creatinophila DSM 6911]
MRNIYDNIPGELKKINNWVCWDSKKVPINPKNGQYAKSNDPSTWADYKTAVETSKRFKGIGFMLGNTDYVAIDIDDLENNKEVAREFVDNLKSYTEYSPSKNGIHIWIKGKVDINKYRKDKVEMYDHTSPRYLTFTGNKIGEHTEINTNVTDDLMKLYKKYIDIEPKKTNVIQMPSKSLELSEREIIDAIQKSNQASKFDSLYSGSWETYYSSQSEADLALSNMLAFWTAKDYQKMDTIFRNSGLMREKWDEKRKDGTYGSIILSKAINDTRDVYTPKDTYCISVDQSQPITPQFGSNSVQAIGRAYHKQTSEGPSMISTFIIELKEIIKDDLDGEFYYRANFISQDYKEELIFKAKEMNNKNDFMSLLQHPSFSFSGSLNDLQEIKKILSNQPYETVRGVSFIGFHEIDKKRVFITQDKAINSDFKEITGITVNESEQVVNSDILKQEEITKKELELLAKHLFKFNDLDITASLISILPVFMLKPLLFPKGIKTPHLVIYGEAGAGKSQTIESILLPFYSLDKENILSCSNVTQFSLLKSLSNTNALPVILDEYKPSFLAEHQVRLISDNLRNTYDCHNATRGTKNQKVVSYPMVSPVVLIGEEGQEETAIKERSVILNFNKRSRIGKEEHFKFLKGHPGLLKKLGRSILSKIIKADVDKLIERRTDLLDGYLSKDITEDRVQENIGNMLLGFDLVIDVFRDLGLNFEKLTDTKILDVISSINKNLFREVLDENKTTKSVIDNTVELFSSMADIGLIHYNYEFTIVNDNELAFHMPSLYPKLTKFIREYNISTEVLTSQNQFTRQLRSAEYFKEYKAVKFDGKSKRSFVLDTEALKKINIDIEGIKNKVTERV